MSSRLVCLLACIIVAGGTGPAHGEPTIGERLATASPERGQQLFLVCRACHSTDAGAAHALGPNLRGVVGRPVASDEGYDPYSPAMYSFGGVWTAERLDRYLHRPMAEVEGTSMVFPGISDAGDRADVIAWLSVVGDSSSIPDESSANSSASTLPPGEARPADFGVLVAEEGADITHAYCTVCHSERIVAQQGLTPEGWREVLDFMVDEHGMAPMPAADLERVIGYLSAHYGQTPTLNTREQCTSVAVRKSRANTRPGTMHVSQTAR